MFAGPALRIAVPLALGAARGVTLAHAGSGFAGTWRCWLVAGGAGAPRARSAMLAPATALFAPLPAAGRVVPARRNWPARLATRARAA